MDLTILFFCRQTLIIENSIINAISVGLCTLKEDRRGNSKKLTMTAKSLLRIIFMLLLTLFALLAYAYFIEPNTLRIENRNFNLDCLRPGELAGKKFVQISDLHFTRKTKDAWLNKIYGAISSQNPTLVFITGDFVSEKEGTEKAVKLVEKISKNFPVYAVFGNHDYWSSGGIEKFRSRLENAGAKVFSNQNLAIKLDGSSAQINLIGVNDPYTSPNAENDLEEALAKMEAGNSSCKILLAHAPNAAAAAQKNNIDLVLAGHTHGGQINIPFITPRIIPARPEGKGFVKGLYKLGGKTQMYVNRGIGYTLIPFRFLVPPEITVITLH